MKNKLKKISVLDKRAVEQGDIIFFELAPLDVSAFIQKNINDTTKLLDIEV
ncbi:MAG: hypothetical protein VSS75_034505 [Candidatus Parabeggiatoa sp.]|nr:hypothetical protein [Candidatus Parabeggiatoa sp.]